MMTTEFLKQNQNANGGGLATNITGKFESNRHAIAKIEKVTFGEAVKELKKKKNGGLEISANYLLEIYTALFGTPEWHHAGKLPKQYGGGMKKTYFLDEVPTFDIVQNWIAQFEFLQIERLSEKEIENKRQSLKIAFTKKYGTKFNRETATPKFSAITESEMSGKYGWFEATSRYNLPIYYSGWAFKSQKSLDKYYSL